MYADPAPDWAVAYYGRGLEDVRLTSGPGLLERERTLELLRRYLRRRRPGSPTSVLARARTACGWPSRATR